MLLEKFGYKRKNDEYFVRTHGLIIGDKQSNYVVSAKTQEEAREIAESKFKSQYIVANNQINSNVEKRNVYCYIFPIIGLLIPVALSHVTWVDGHDAISIAPDLISTIYATIFYGAFIIRIKGLKTFKSFWDIVTSILIILITASIFQIILVKKEFSFFWTFNVSLDTNTIIVFALILSWIGIKLVSCLCYVFIALLALSNLTLLNSAMGVAGPVFVVFTFFSICIYLANDPELKNAIPMLFSNMNKGIIYLKNDFNSGKKEFDKIKENISNQLNDLD